MTDEQPRKATVGDHVATAFVRAHEALRPHNRKHADERLTTWLDAFEDEMSAAIGPHLAAAIDHPDTPPDVAELFRKLTGPENATGSSLLFAAVGALLYPLVSAAMSGKALMIEQGAMALDTPAALSPAEIALGQLRHTLGGIDANREAAKSGIDPARLKVLALNTGDGLPVGEALLLFRRGQITEARLIESLRQSRTRDEWLPEILALRYAPPSPAEVISGLVEGHLDQATAQKLFQEAGIAPEHFGWMFETAGRPLGLETMLSLMNRGLLTQEQVRAAIRESNVKNKYIDAAIESAVYIPPVRTVSAMLRAHAITDAEATKLYKEHGVRDTDIPGYIKATKTQRTQTTRDLTAAQIVRLYETKLITRAAAAARVVALRYDPDEADAMLDLADAVAAERRTHGAVARVHNLYVAHKIDRNAVVTDLDALGISPEARTEYLAVWDDERAANVVVLPLSGLQGLLRREAMTLARFRQRVLAIGWHETDVRHLALLAFPPNKLPKVIFDWDGQPATIPNYPPAITGA